MLRALPVLAALALVTPRPAPAAAPRPGVGYDHIVAVVVGISAQKPPWDPLPNAARDAERFATLLATRGVAVIELYDEQATEDAILHALEVQAPAALGGDITAAHRNLLIVYFVGHGQTIGDPSAREGFLVPYGATSRAGWISMRDLNGLHTLSGAFRHQLFVLGSCFGGELLRDGALDTPAALARNDAASRWLERGLSKVARVGLTAGDAGQKVPDGPVGGGSEFGNALVNALEARGGSARMSADYNNDGCVSWLELAAFVANNGRSDHNSPRVGTLYRDDQGTIALCGQHFAKAPPVKTAGVRFRGGVPEGFVEVPAGSFLMGSPEGEEGRESNEGPQRWVTFSRPLWIQTHEVTQRQWREVMKTSPSHHTGCDDCPVEQVNWYEAAAYANAKSRAEGLAECYALTECGPGEPGGGCPDDSRADCSEGLWQCKVASFVGAHCAGYRLPTEAEWEYFARAGTRTRYGGGDAEAALSKAGWHYGNSGGETRPLGQKAANGWGLFDVHGNVWEWCQDWYAASYPAASATDPAGPRSGYRRAMRGASFENTARGARSAVRGGRRPEVRDRDVGFRLVRAPRAP